jgi:hypothetical protein
VSAPTIVESDHGLAIRLLAVSLGNQTTEELEIRFDSGFETTLQLVTVILN